MTTATYFHKHEDGLLARAIGAAKSFGTRFVAIRQKQAERYVNAYLATLDDKSLARLGLDRKTIDKAPKAFYPDY